MGLVDQINALIWSWAETFRALSRRVALLPLAIYTAAQAVILLAIAGFAHPTVSWFMLPFLKWRFGEPVLHYPNNFLVLRAGLGEIDPFIAVFLGAMTTASAVLLFGRFYQRRRTGFGEAWRTVSKSYWAFVLATVIATRGLTDLLLSRLHASGRVPMCSVYLWDRGLDAFACVADRGSGATRAMVGMGAGASTLRTRYKITHGDQMLADFDIAATSGGRGGLISTGSFLQATSWIPRPSSPTTSRGRSSPERPG